jgi:4-amino-4-deoxy-L-arabinose transferase-like glycosyltransferase
VRLPILIACIVALKAIAIFVVLPIVARSLSHSYGIGFADDYDLLGWSLSQGNGYRFLPDTAPTLMREPGYPLFLAGLFWLFGKSLGAIRVANLLLTAITAWLTYRLADRIFSSKAIAFLASVLLLIHPAIFVAELRGGVEILFTLLIVCFISALLAALQSGRFKDFFLAGLVLGVATLVRSTALLFPVFLVPFFLLWKSARPSWIRACGVIAVVLAGAMITISPWMIRNWKVAGVPIPTSSVQPIAAHAGQYICSNRSLYSNFQDLDSEAAEFRSRFGTQHGFRFAGGYYMYFYDVKDELAFSKLLAQHVIENYERSPTLIFRCSAINVFNFWFTGKDWTATAMNALVQLPYLILGVLGMIFTLKSGRGSDGGILMLFIAYLMLVHLPVHAQARYSVPLIPLLAIFAAVAALNIRSRLRATASVAPRK